MNMKKISSRTAAALLAFAASASAAAVNAGAVDYGMDPNYPAPNTGVVIPADYPSSPPSSGNTGGNTSSGNNTGSSETPSNTSSSSNAASNAADTPAASSVQILTSETVSAAIQEALSSGESTASIHMSANSSGSVTVKEDTIAAIASGNVAVKIDVAASGKNNMSYSVTIDPGMITEIDGNLNIGLNIEKKEKMETVNGGAYVPTDAVVITPAGSGNFGATLQVTLPSSALRGMKKSKVRLYSVSRSGKVTKVDDDAIFIGNDGSVTILIDNGDSQLVISDKDLVKANEKANKLKEEKSSSSKTAKTSKTKSAAAFGTADIAALSAAGILTQKKKKKK